jgi:hypothetical protein
MIFPVLIVFSKIFLKIGVFSTLRAVPQKEGYLGLYKGNGAMMIRIFPYGAIQFMAFEHYKTVVRFSSFLFSVLGSYLIFALNFFFFI